jgi:drug/metabolite transporter (DMT)-like permease
MIFERRQLNRQKLKNAALASIVAGTVLFIASALQQFGIEITQSAGKSGFITGLYTVLVPVISFVIYRQKKNIGVWLGAIVAVIGLFLLSINESLAFGVGDLVLLIGAFFWAAHILVIDRFVNNISPLCFSMMQFAVCAALNLIAAFAFEEITMTAIENALGPLLYGGLCSVGIAYTLQTIGQKSADPAFAAIIFSTESVFSAIGGALILNEKMLPRGYLGCLLIFNGVIVSQITFGKKKNKKS